MKKLLLLLCISIIISVVLPVVFYLIFFGEWELSSDFDDWIRFSQFFILFITLLNGMVMVILMWHIHRTNLTISMRIHQENLGKIPQEVLQK